MIEGLRRALLRDDDWGEINLLFPLAQPEDPWGVLSPLRGTVWGDQIPLVSGETLSHAFHGWLTPLMREIGVDPLVHARRIPSDKRHCEQQETCPIANSHCQPGPKISGCFDPVDLDRQAARLAQTVASAWSEGHYVVVVVGSEFNLR